MARGTAEKEQVQNIILDTFENSFIYGKEIRVPIGDVQIKITLTCAKENVAEGADTAIPGVKATKVTINEGSEPIFEDASKLVEPSVDELNEISNLMESLGF